MTNHELPLFVRLFQLRRSALVLGSLLLGSSGCTRWMRDPDFYAQELTAALEQREAPIEACYERALEHDPKAAGELIVGFEVERKSGALRHVVVDAKRTTAPSEVAACVTDELATVVLDPPDAKTATATYTWVFAPGPRKRPPIDPFAGAQQALLDCYSNHLATADRAATGALVIDYAFDRASGTLETLEVVTDGTTAPEPVVACMITALRSVTLAPSVLEDRNVTGRRTFTLRFDPWAPSQPG